MVIDSIFLHYFDIHFIREKKQGCLFPSIIFQEMYLATKFSLLSANTVIVPASSFFESPECNEIILSFSCLFDSGMIFITGNASSVEEFAESKTIEYQENEYQRTVYSEILSTDFHIPFARKNSSSSKAISKYLQKILTEGSVPNLFSNSGAPIPRNIERRWERIPEKLAHKAYIVENIQPLLFSNGQKSITISNKLLNIINKPYFGCYIDELNCSFVSDLAYLGSDYLPQDITLLSLPYKYIHQALRKKGLLKKIYDLKPENLLEYRESEEWAGILSEAYTTKETVWKTYYASPSITIQNVTVMGDNVMGDKFVGTNVGIMGPNSTNNTISMINISGLQFPKENLVSELNELVKTVTKDQDRKITESELDAIKSAIKELQSENEAGCYKYLKLAGKKIYQFAESIGLSLAAKAIAAALGL